MLLITDEQTSWAGEHFIPYTWDMTTEKFGWMSLDADRKFVYPMCEIGFPPTHSYTTFREEMAYPGPRIGCNEAVLVEPCRSSLALLLLVPRSVGSSNQTWPKWRGNRQNKQWFGTQDGNQSVSYFGMCWNQTSNRPPPELMWQDHLF